jgi:hypothetical protein
MPTSSGSLALTAYVGDAAVLFAFSLDPAELKTNELANFSPAMPGGISAKINGLTNKSAKSISEPVQKSKNSHSTK